MEAGALAGGVRAGNHRAVARALTTVESGGAAAEELLRALSGPPAHGGRTVGVTGAPGVGKSTLIEALGGVLLAGGERVAVLAVDPSSPFSGGALLGDRVRMTGLVVGGAFVRSMATRGAQGGVAAATADALAVLAAAGFDWIIVETVGVGQDEVDVAGVVDTVVVVTVAGLGDEVQAAKAGLLEIAHVFAVNKADQAPPEAEIAALEGMLAMGPAGPWRPLVLAVSAVRGDGVGRLVDAIREHQSHLETGGGRSALRRQRTLARLERLLGGLAWRTLVDGNEKCLADVVAEVTAGRLDPHAGARRLLATLLAAAPLVTAAGPEAR